MATRTHNLSKFDAPLPSAADMKFGIVVAEWNREVTRSAARRSCPHAPQCGVSRPEHPDQIRSRNVRADARRAVFCRIHRRGRCHRSRLRRAGRHAPFRFHLPRHHAGDHPTADPVEHAGDLRRAHGKRHAAGHRPGGRTRVTRATKRRPRPSTWSSSRSTWRRPPPITCPTERTSTESRYFIKVLMVAAGRVIGPPFFWNPDRAVS